MQASKLANRSLCSSKSLPQSRYEETNLLVNYGSSQRFPPPIADLVAVIEQKCLSDYLNIANWIAEGEIHAPIVSSLNEESEVVGLERSWVVVETRNHRSRTEMQRAKQLDKSQLVLAMMKICI